MSTVIPATLTFGAMLDLARAVATPEDGALLLGALVRRAQSEDPTLTDEKALIPGVFSSCMQGQRRGCDA